MDYDRIAVLDRGKLVEFGRPHALLERGPENGWLAKMVADMGPEAEAAMKAIAKQKEGERLEAEAAKTQKSREPQLDLSRTRTRITNLSESPLGARMNPNDPNMFSIPISAGFKVSATVDPAGVEYADADYDEEAPGAL